MQLKWKPPSASLACIVILALWASGLFAQSGEKETVSYLALGDSYTIGESVKKAERWPVQLGRLLASKGVEMGTPELIAKTGWTTDELLAAIEQRKPQGGRDLVTLLIGVNNQYRGRDAQQYAAEFEVLLKKAIRLAKQDAKRVVVVSIPDYGLTPFIAERQERQPSKIALELDQYNAVAKRVTSRFGAHWVDITGLSRKHGKDLAMVAEDGLHPSEKMYALWAKEVLPVALGVLKQEP